jgi:glycosyltransferase involved in cell wall biosynthesis
MRQPTQRFRVAYLGHTARLSGAEIGLLRFIQATDAIDARVVLAEDGPLVGALRDAGAHVEVLPLAEEARELRRAELRPGLGQARAAIEVARYVGTLRGRLRHLEPDLVHTNSLKAGVYGSLAARLAGLPVVWHLHDRLARDYLPTAAVPPMRALASTVPSALIAPSKTTLDAVGQRFRPGLRTAVIPFPIPVPERAVDLRSEVRRVGIVGRLTPWKGQHIFLEAFARAYPEGEVGAVVIGAAMFGEEAYERGLHAQAKRLGIAARVDFLGFTNDVQRELERLDILVHASVLPDPLATVVLEGMAAGVPLVAARAGGHAEYIRDGQEGLLHRPGDADALAGALRRAAQDGELRRRMSEAGRRKARRFAPEVVVERMLALYRDVLRGRASVE